MVKTLPELLFPDPPLMDEIVLLRPWEAKDVPNTMMGFAEPRVQRFSWPNATPYTEEDARSSFTDQEQARRRGEELSFAFVEPDDPEAVLGGVRCTPSTAKRAAPRSATGWLRARADVARRLMPRD